MKADKIFKGITKIPIQKINMNMGDNEMSYFKADDTYYFMSKKYADAISVIVKAFALKNAVEHDGKADEKAVMKATLAHLKGIGIELDKNLIEFIKFMCE